MNSKTIKRNLFVVIAGLALFCFVPAIEAQSDKPAVQKPQAAKDDKNNKQRKGSITGRVTDDGGQPLLDAEVQLTPYNNPNSSPTVSIVDGEGNFRFDNLRAGSYTVRASSPGFVPANEASPIQGAAVYHLEDSVSLAMTKGSVITGTVTNQDGEPMIAVVVRAVRIRDANNRKTAEPERNTFYSTSDDRGIYRLYGLRAGTYLVCIGGFTNYYFGDVNNTEHPAVYYPSSTLDSAAEVTLQPGQEMSGINVRFREFAGYKISGTVANAKDFIKTDRSGVSVSLKLANTEMEANSTYLGERDERYSFTLDNIADGEYLIRATAYLPEQGYAASEWQKVTIKGADITGLNLMLSRLGSMNGRVIFEENKAEKKDEACKDSRAASFEEIILFLPRDEKGESAKDAWAGSLTLGAASETKNVPDESGAFTAKNLRAGKRRIIVKLPTDNLFVRSITGVPIAPSKSPQDIGRNGITLKQGEEAKDIKVTIAEGAARIAGKILPGQEGANLPDNLLVHLVPAEKESADDALRYFETTTEADGSFSISNIPPGKYFVLVRPMKTGEEKEVYRRPISWDDAARTKLRKDAEAANQTVELTTCKRINDFVLKLK